MAIGWVEQRVARERAAVAFLQDRGFSVTRTSGNLVASQFYVSGWSGAISGSQLVGIATQHGFECEAAIAPPSAAAIVPDMIAPPPGGSRVGKDGARGEASGIPPVSTPLPDSVESAEVLSSPPSPSSTEERDMADRKPITFTAEGAVLRAIEAKAKAEDLAFSRAAALLLEESLTPVDPSPAVDGLAEIDTDELLDELRRRFDGAGRVADLERDLAEANERARSSEAQLGEIRDRVLGLAEFAR